MTTSPGSRADGPGVWPTTRSRRDARYRQPTGPHDPAASGIAPRALALLALPDRDAVTYERARGATCVWGEERLTSETAVDLGERVTGRGEHWWPRACGPHAQRAALLALHDHAPRCEQCVGDAARCPAGLGLRRLMRAGR